MTTTSGVTVNLDTVQAIVDRVARLTAEAKQAVDELGSVGLYLPGDFHSFRASDHLQGALNEVRRMQLAVRDAKAGTGHA